MGHTGITEFMRIGRFAEDFGIEIIPHATIGSGIFLAASLQASSTLGDVTSHEFQHSVFEPFRHFTGDVMECTEGQYAIPTGTGICVEPSEVMRKAMTPIPA